MSGIAGIFNLDDSPVDKEPLEGMVALLRPQGPHGQAMWIEGPAALGHSLFRATIESENESQPCSLDGKVWISADVFLVGREELVEALRNKGREASLDRPDPELILHAYHAWGTDCLEKLVGYFAFILWDGPKRRVFAARDHFGNRTLYYAHRGSLLVMSGLLDAVARHPGIASGLSEFHVASFLALGSVRYLDEGGSAYEGVRSLRPAEFLVAERGGVRVKRYWECPAEVPPFRYRREEEVLEHYRSLFERLIQDRLRSRRVAIALSGGMDSTSVTAMIARAIQKRGHGPELVALSQDHRRTNATQEAILAAQLCRQYDLPLTLMPMDDVPWLTPDYSPVTLMLYPLANQQQEFVRRLAALAPVVMFGSSGDLQRTASLRDALRAGSPLDAIAGFLTAWRKHGMRPELNLGFQRGIDVLRRRKGHYDRHFPEWLQPDLAHRRALQRGYEDHDKPPLEGEPRRNLRHPSLQYWWARKDNGTVLHGNAPGTPFEGLDPLGDKRLCEFLLSLPPMPWLANKYLQREAMRGLLPDEIRLRPRQSILSHHPPFLRDVSNSWIDTWQADLRLEAFLRRDAIPRLVGAPIPPHQALVHLRPWLLNQWLKGR